MSYSGTGIPAAASKHLHFARCTTLTCESGGAFAGSRATLDTSNNAVGEDSAVTIGLDSLPIISYYDEANGDLKIRHCGTLGCNP